MLIFGTGADLGGVGGVDCCDEGAGGGGDDEGDVWGDVGGLACADGEVCSGSVLRSRSEKG